MKITAEHKAVIGSYARAFLAAALAMYISGEHDLKKLWAAGIAAILPPLYRWLNPKDTAFGRSTTN